MHRFKIKLGVEAKSMITGFTGIVTGRSWNHAGCDRYVLQPPMGEDGKVGESMFYDDVELKVLDDTGDMVKPELGAEFTHNMLDEAECTITKFKGTITGFVQYLNGCKHVWLQPKVGDKKEMKVPDGQWVALEDIKVTKAYKAPKTKPSRPPGGPPSSMR